MKAIAKKTSDGHLTIMRFTTGWKVIFSTPDLTEESREQIWNLKTHRDIRDAMKEAILGGVDEIFMNTKEEE